ncbi:MAG TPA: hypothetical protein VNA89_15430, partial [Gemmatimonadaceae bacterium]|nr:hypothetical protein [Gemmatimonadaceae bacterium]
SAHDAVIPGLMHAAKPTVLILSPDALTAALLAALVEFEGLAPAFGEDSEPPRKALRRMRPRVVLVDVDHATACTPSFLGPAAMTGARVLLFGPERAAAAVRETAAAHSLSSFTLPVGAAAFGRLLDGAD